MLDMPGEYTLFVDLLIIDASGALYVHRRPTQIFTYRETPAQESEQGPWILGLPAQVEEWIAEVLARYPNFLESRMHAYHNAFENVLFWTVDYQQMSRRAEHLYKELEAARQAVTDVPA